MKLRLTKSGRAKIVAEFAERHGGSFSPGLFLDEVRAAGEAHPAYAWFTWDQDRAALEHNLAEARAFVQDLKIRFTISEVGRTGSITVRTAEMPLALSPTDGRANGGGYRITNPNDPEHVAEHCRQGATALRSWIARYADAVRHAGGDLDALESTINSLDVVVATRNIDAA